MEQTTPTSACPSVLDDMAQLRWAFEQAHAIKVSYEETQRLMDTKAYRAAAVFAVVTAFGVQLCRISPTPAWLAVLCLLAITGVGTLAGLWRTVTVVDTDDFNVRNLWDAEIAAAPTTEALRAALEAVAASAEAHLATAKAKAFWARRTQLWAGAGLAVALLTMFVARCTGS